MIVEGRPARHDGDAVACLVPPFLRGATPRRLATYAAGRHCAMRALAAAGSPDWLRPIDRAPDGAPLWPRGYVGSISHTDAYALAIVAPTTHVRSLGVDCERVITDDEVEGIARAAIPEIEQVSVQERARHPISPAALVTLAFSAKESLYKCLRPLVGAYFDFTDAHVVRVDVGARRLTLRLVRALGDAFPAGMELELTIALEHDMVATLIALIALDTTDAADATRLADPSKRARAPRSRT
jgi:enterobactin synthetase component D